MCVCVCVFIYAHMYAVVHRGENLTLDPWTGVIGDCGTTKYRFWESNLVPLQDQEMLSQSSVHL